jgi:6-phosphogluconolactonase
VEVVRLPDPEAVARAAAERIALAVSAAAASHISHLAHVALAGGSTPMHAYEVLGPMLDDWSAVHLWYSDERCVPPDHPDSNHGQAAARLQASGAHWHRMPGELGPDQGAAQYSAELDGTILDLTLLGMGPDGHTASLFPDHKLLAAGGVAIGVHDSPKPPPERITLTLDKINESHGIMLMVTGAEKAEALARVLAGPDRATPASLLDRDRLVIVADEAALPS